MLVVGDDGRNVVVPGDGAGELYDAGGADVGELLQLDHLVDEPARAVREAEPPTGHAIRLAEAVEDDGVLVVLGGTAERAVVAKRAVDLIAE